MNMPAKSVNAWIYLKEDEPSGTSYHTSGSCYQTLRTYGVYGSVDFLSICFANPLPTSATTVPAGDGSSFTIQIEDAAHPDGSTNQQYMEWVIQDARATNPNIKLLVMLGYPTGAITQIFGADPSQWPLNAADFAANLVAYLQKYGLDGLDVDWESPISNEGTPQQFALLFGAIRKAFDAQDRSYYLTISPDMVGTLDVPTLNSAFDWVTLQIYDMFTCAEQFTSVGVNPGLLMYGAKFEPNDGVPYQNAQQAAAGMPAPQAGCQQSTSTNIITNWRLNSGNYQYEQAQQMILYQLVHGVPGPSFNDAPIVGAAGNPPISQLTVRSGDVLDAIQATNAGSFQGNPVEYTLPRHGGNGGGASTVAVASGDAVARIDGFTGTWFGWECVLQITITTRYGQVFGPFGSMAHSTTRTPFSLAAPPGQSIVALSGGTVNVPVAGGNETFVVASLNAVYA